MTKSISVIIPNYNGSDLLKKNLPYTYAALATSGISDYEIIVTDDASKDDSVAFLKDNYQDIRIVLNHKNLGFSGNVNSGIKIAQKDLLLILNNDVRLGENYFTTLLPYFERPDTFGVMGRIIADDSDKIQDGAKYPGYSFSAIISTKNYVCNNRNSLYSFFLSGANALTDRKKTVLMGGFNEIFNPYYSEDADLGINAWRAGYKLYYDHRAVCRHPNSATIGKEPSDKVKIIARRNKYILHYLHLDGPELVFYLLKVILKTFFRSLTLTRIYTLSFRSFIHNLKKILAIRKQYQPLRKYSIREINDFIKKDIENDEIEVF